MLLRTLSLPREVVTTAARTGSALRSFYRQGRDSSRLTKLVGGKRLRPDNQPDGLCFKLCSPSQLRQRFATEWTLG